MANENVTLNRNKYIGGSDLPSILGYNIKYGKSIFDFGKEKAGITPNTFKGNEYTRYGQLMEPVIRDYINAIHGCNYKEDTNIKGSYRGNTDGLDPNSDIGILEVKTFGKNLDIDYYEPQCQFYMHIFNQNACRLVGYKRPELFYNGVDYELEHDNIYFNTDFNKDRIVEHVIQRDPKKWAEIEERVSKFKDAVQALKDNPNMDENEFNKLLYGNELMILTDKLSVLENTLLNYKNIEKEYKALKDKIYKLFDEKNILTIENEQMKITRVNPSSYEKVSLDTDKLKNDNPNIYDKYKVVKNVKKKGYVLITKKEVQGNE